MRYKGGPGTDTPGQWSCTTCTLPLLLSWAWDCEFKRLQSVEKLLDIRYDIVAKIPPGTTKDAFHQMIRRLLVERIGLVASLQASEQDVLELVVAKGGLKMKEAQLAPEGDVSQGAVPNLIWDKNGDPNCRQDRR